MLQLPRHGNLGATVATKPVAAVKWSALDALGGGDSRLARGLCTARQGLVNGPSVLLLGETGTGKEVVARASTKPARARTNRSLQSTAQRFLKG